MLILPALDLRQGAAVRLLQGRFDAVTDYGNPFARLRSFADAGASWVHVVDLDGAKVGRPVQHELIARLAQETGLKIQCGGGVRSRADVEALLKAGAKRVVVGSVAARDPSEVRGWIANLGVEQICIALDVRAHGGRWIVAADGWTAQGALSLEEVLAELSVGELRHVLVTDISRDGALTGPNVRLVEAMRDLRPDLCLQASGGVSSLEDIEALKRAGAGAAIIGRALYDNRFTLEDALAV